MSSSKQQTSMDDVVSICVFCREDGTVLINFDDNCAQFPSLAIFKSSWRLTVRKLISMVNGLSGKEIMIMRVTKFWLPDTPYAFHIIYKVKCPLPEKKIIKLQGTVLASMRWMTMDQVQQMCLSGNLTSPELVEYVAQSLQPRNLYPLTTDPEAGKDGFDILYEVLERQILMETDGSFLTPQEQLLKSAHFSKTEQKKIYKEFVMRSFPNLLMNRYQFESFMTELGWKKEEWPGLFECADVLTRGGMTFRDFILFVAATEPETPHGSGSGEIRCQYIFRYFDKNKDNYLDSSELKSLITTIASAKGGARPKDLEKLIDLQLSELGVGLKQRLSMSTFVKRVGELKFRGTSTIFRSKMSVLKLVPSASFSEVANSNSAQKQPNKSTVVPRKMSNWRGISTLAMGPTPDNVADFLKMTKNPAVAKQKTFEIATHAVRLTKDGLLDEVRPIDRITHGKSISMVNQDLFVRLPSLQYYDEKMPANELLSALQFFISEIQTSKMKKQRFTWGKYDVFHQMTLLLSVCEKAIRIMEKEPRMVQINSPVYILGDLHGNLPDLMVFEQVLWGLGMSLSPCCLLFLGDYVDRGPNGLEVISYLFAQKVKNPNKVFLLRGNHEIRPIQRAFTFYGECQRRFGEDYYYEVWNTINRVFDVMPLAAVVDSKLFCCHGGIPPPWLCSRIEQIDSIPCPLPTPEEESILAWELMWNDPVKSEHVTPAVSQEMDANEGFAVNTTRKTGRFFSYEALETFLRRNDLTHVIRAHEVKTAGFQIQQGGKLLTVFSSSGYCGGPNEAACVFVSQEKIRLFRIKTS